MKIGPLENFPLYSLYMYVCVCVCERERETERGGGRSEREGGVKREDYPGMGSRQL